MVIPFVLVHQIRFDFRGQLQWHSDKTDGWEVLSTLSSTSDTDYLETWKGSSDGKVNWQWSK